MNIPCDLSIAEPTPGDEESFQLSRLSLFSSIVGEGRWILSLKISNMPRLQESNLSSSVGLGMCRYISIGARGETAERYVTFLGPAMQSPDFSAVEVLVED